MLIPCPYSCIIEKVENMMIYCGMSMNELNRHDSNREIILALKQQSVELHLALNVNTIIKSFSRHKKILF